MSKRVPLRCWVAVLMLAAVPRGAESGQIADVSTPALARRADAIVLAACDAGASSWNDEPRVIVTRYQCHVEQTLKGQPSDTVTVQVLGGQVGDVSMESSASVAVVPGADVVLLLQRSQFGTHYVIAGGASGMLAVSPAPHRMVQGMSLSEFAHWVTTEAAPR